jgi:hypothetical protein
MNAPKSETKSRLGRDWFHGLISLIAIGGAITGWQLWFSFGGWQRHQHWADGTLWGISGVIGIWSAIDAVRFARGPLTACLGVLVCLFHLFALLLFWMFVNLLAMGGPRP